MNRDRTIQEQSQSLTVAQEQHGMTDEIHCQYRPGIHAMDKRGGAIKVLIFHGKVTKVFCPDFKNGLCNSSMNKGGDGEKACFMYDSD